MENEEGLGEMESGYAEDSAEKPESEAPEISETQQPEIVEEKPDPLRELAARFEQLEQRTRKAESHIGGLNQNQKVLQETLTASRAVTQRSSDAPTQDQVQDAMESPKEWEDLKSEFPDWADGMQKYMDSRLAKVGSVDVDGITSRLSAAEERAKAAEDRATQVERKSAERELTRMVPEWRSKNTPEFFNWLEQQSEEVRTLAGSWEPEDAAQVYKLHSDSTKRVDPSKQLASRQKRIEAAVTPKGTGGFAASRTELDEMEAGYSSR